MSIIANIFEYDFLTNAFIASILSGITCGIVGSYIVTRRIVFLSSGITHASFGGLGIALYAGIDPLLGALSFASVSALGTEFASRRGRIREDSVVGIIWSLGMAIGALFMSLRPGYATDLTSYLFGNILLVTPRDIVWLAILTLLLTIGALTWLRRLMYITFDEEYAKSQGINHTCSIYYGGRYRHFYSAIYQGYGYHTATITNNHTYGHRKRPNQGLPQDNAPICYYRRCGQR